MTQRKVWFIKLTDAKGRVGFGEVAPLSGLSVEDIDTIEDELAQLKQKIRGVEVSSPSEIFITTRNLVGSYPSIRFGLEMALLDLINGGKQVYFHSPFLEGKKAIPINGLVWMNTAEHMKIQAKEKLDMGFDCIKIKVGALDFEVELEVLDYVRTLSENVILRVDANGGFSPKEAMGKLERLSKFNLHSIEQPVKAGMVDDLATLCESSPVPIALDEELIGIRDREMKESLLNEINPAYLVLKPGLLGGFQETREWIELAEKYGIGWWITSALESNLGLNAISQFTACFAGEGHQGLGTGGLFHNNLASKVELNGSHLGYNKGAIDEVPSFEQI